MLRLRLTHFLKKVIATPPTRLPRVLYRATHRLLKEYRLRSDAMRHRGEIGDADFFRAISVPNQERNPSDSRLPMELLFSTRHTTAAVFVGEFNRLFPRLKENILCQAEEVLKHHFDLLGSGKVDLGPKIDWHRDFKSGHRWEPGKYGKRVIFGQRADNPVALSRERTGRGVDSDHWAGVQHDTRQQRSRI